MKQILFSLICISLIPAAFAGTDVSDKNAQSQNEALEKTCTEGIFTFKVPSNLTKIEGPRSQSLKSQMMQGGRELAKASGTADPNLFTESSLTFFSAYELAGGDLLFILMGDKSPVEMNRDEMFNTNSERIQWGKNSGQLSNESKGVSKLGIDGIPSLLMDIVSPKRERMQTYTFFVPDHPKHSFAIAFKSSEGKYQTTIDEILSSLKIAHAKTSVSSSGSQGAFVVDGTLVDKSGTPVTNQTVYVFPLFENAHLKMQYEQGKLANPRGTTDVKGKFQITVPLNFVKLGENFTLGIQEFVGLEMQTRSLTRNGVLLVFSLSKDDTLRKVPVGDIVVETKSNAQSIQAANPSVKLVNPQHGQATVQGEDSSYYYFKARIETSADTNLTFTMNTCVLVGKDGQKHSDYWIHLAGWCPGIDVISIAPVTMKSLYTTDSKPTSRLNTTKVDNEKGAIKYKIPKDGFVELSFMWSVPSDFEPDRVILTDIADITLSKIKDQKININYVNSFVKPETPTSNLEKAEAKGSQAVQTAPVEGDKPNLTGKPVKQEIDITDSNNPKTQQLQYDEQVRIIGHGVMKGLEMGHNPVFIAIQRDDSIAIVTNSKSSRVRDDKFIPKDNDLVINAGDRPVTIFGIVLCKGEGGIIKDGKCTKINIKFGMDKNNISQSTKSETKPQTSNRAESTDSAESDESVGPSTGIAYVGTSRLFRTPLWEIKIESFRWVEFVNMDVSSKNVVEQKFGNATVIAPREGFKFLALLCDFDAQKKAEPTTQPEKDILLSYSGQLCELLGLYLGNPIPYGIKPSEQGYATTKFEAVFVVPKSASSEDVTIRVQNSNAPAFLLNSIEEVKDGKLIQYDRKKSIQLQGQTKEPESRDEKKTKDLFPVFKEELQGSNPVRVKNPNSFAVSTGIRSGQKGVNFDVPANGVETVYVPDGSYDIYFVYSDKPDALFQGDSFTLNNDGVEIQIVQIVNGNYNIKQVK
jgi:hypothetical protein